MSVKKSLRNRKVRMQAALVMACLAGGAMQSAAADTATLPPADTTDLGEMVVTATKTTTALHELGYSTTLVTRDEIERTKFTYVTDLLQTIPGLDYRSNGPHASTATLSIRGLEGYHTKVLINGIPVQDSSGTQVRPTLNDLFLTDVERIEVVRGGSSTLYGSNAIGGVVNIITRRGEDGIHGRVGVEAGSHGFQKYTLGLNGAEGIADFAITSTYTDQRGISVKSDNDENDIFRMQSHSARLGLQLADNLRLDLFGRLAEGDEEYDDGWAWDDGSAVNGDFHLQNYQAGAQLSAKNLFEFWDSTLSASATQARRSDRDTLLKSLYIGDTYEMEWQNSLRLDARNTFTIGYAYTEERADVDAYGTVIDERHRTDAIYAQHQFEPVENLFLTAGLRYNNHSVFGEETTYSGSAAYLIAATGTRLRASFNTGYRSPSLYELFAPGTMWGPLGNANLEPETSENWDVGFEQELHEGRVKFGVTYFETRVEDYIYFDWMLGYAQASGIKTHGLESFIAWQATDDLSMRLSHTWQDTTSMETEDDLPYRARNKAAADLNYRFLKQRAKLNLNAVYVGRRDKSQFELGPQRVDEYVLANLALSYQLTEQLEIFGRIHNLLNENYEVIRGYNSYDRSYYVGLNYTF